MAILNLLIARDWGLSLRGLVAHAAEALSAKVKGDTAPVLEFVKTRLRGLLVDKGLPAEAVDAVLEATYDDVPDAARRADAVARLRRRADFDSLAVAWKRVANILKGRMRDPDIPAEVKDPANWPASMREEWGDDEGASAAARHRATRSRSSDSTACSRHRQMIRARTPAVSAAPLRACPPPVKPADGTPVS